MGFYRPDSGATFVNGLESFSNYSKILKDVGYLPGEPALPLSYTGKEFIAEMKALKGVEDETVLKELIAYFECDPNLPCKEMSMGMKRKMAIIVAFMSDPDILVLDEPTSGLDPLMQQKFIDFVKDQKKKGKTILLSSHIFSEVDATCDRIGIIKDGHLVSEVEAEALKHNSLKTFVISFRDPQSYADFRLHGISPKIRIADQDEKTMTLWVLVDDADINELIALLSHYPIRDFHQEKQTLQDYFMSFYKEDQVFTGVGK
jgi:ABC-2 type transport system ATP-binding protein